MKLKVGRVLKAQGIKGELKVLCLLDDAAMLSGVKQLYLNNNLHRVIALRPNGNFFFVQIEGVSDRNSAENFRDWDVFCDKELLPLPDGRYFVQDILGCAVLLDDGQIVGTVKEVLQYGAADVYVCDGKKGEISFPALKDLILCVDIAAKQLKLSADRFRQVAVDSATEEVRDED